MRTARSQLAAAAALLVPALLAARAPAATAADPAVPAAPQATTSLVGRADAFASSARAGQNYGGDTRLLVGWRDPYQAARALLRFDMQDLSNKEAVTAATLRLYVREAGPAGDAGRDIPVQRVTGEWSEGAVTWNAFPGVDDGRLATVNLGTGAGWREWGGLRDVVRRWRLPAWQIDHYGNRGLFVQGYEAAGSFRAFDSREGANKPQLKLEHRTDVWPPTSRLGPLPPYVNAGSPEALPPDRARLTLAWEGTDPEPWTGIDFYRVYAQRNDGTFVLVFDQVEAQSKAFEARNGGLYRFSVYAVDQAENVEQPKGPEAQTHIDLTAPTVLMSTLPEYVNGPFTLSWVGSDGPTGPDMVPSGIVAYNAYFRINSGPWQPTALGVTATSKIFDDPLVDDAVYEFAAGAYDRAGNLSAPVEPQARTQLDRKPPLVVFEPAPGVTGGSFAVGWRGEDFGGSGVAQYDVQVRRNREPWVDWVRSTTETRRVYQGTYSNTYCFRARARDRAGNQGAYPDREQLVVGVVDPGIWVSNALLPVLRRGR